MRLVTYLLAHLKDRAPMRDIACEMHALFETFAVKTNIDGPMASKLEDGLSYLRRHTQEVRLVRIACARQESQIA